MFGSDHRIPLRKGTKLAGKIVYEIDSFLASGGSCLVYNAHYFDDAATHYVILKECYPIAEYVIRKENGELEWANFGDDHSINKATSAAKTLNSFENDPKLASNVPTSIDNFKANNTTYNVVSAKMSENAAVYSKYSEDIRIKDILKTMASLTGVVEKLHNSRRLHLDLKPGNFMVDRLPESDDQKLIILFDVDSIIEVNAEGKIEKPQTITFSDGYCATELSRGDEREICFGTDLFSIGVILYEKIFGHLPSKMDFWPVAHYDFSKSSVFVDENGNEINPAVKATIHRILKKTLALTPEFRYKTAQELEEELKAAIELCKCPYIVKKRISSFPNFRGRDDEIRRIKERFAPGHGMFIISGPGGYGKTWVAREFCERNYEEYNALVYFKAIIGDSNASDMISNLLSNVDIQNLSRDPQETNEDYDKKCLDKKRELLNKNDVLVLLDNFDMPRSDKQIKEYKEFFRIIQEEYSNANIIITTRTDLKELFDGNLEGNTEQVKLDAIPFEESFQMFSENCMRNVSDQKESYKELFDFEQGNTLVLFILSRLFYKDRGYKTINDLLQRLKAKQNLGGINVYQDKNAENALCDIYDITGLQDGDQRALSIVYLFRRTVLNQEMIWKIYGDDRYKIINDIEDLVTAGWVTKSDDSYYLHPLVKYVVEKRIKPSINYFPELKPFEFYMYFSFKYDERKDFTIRGIKQKEHELLLHFEEFEEKPLDSVVFPKDTPLLLEHQFVKILESQSKGQIGKNISIDPENEYYESKNNCIFEKKKRGNDIFLDLVGIHSSEIPNDNKDINTILGSCAYAYNKSDCIRLPQSVSMIWHEAFFNCCAKVIYIPKTVRYVKDRAFSRTGKDTTIQFESLPDFIDPKAFYLSKSRIEFSDPDMEWVGDCLVCHKEETLEYIRCPELDHEKVVINVPDCVKKISRSVWFIPFRGLKEYTLKLNANIAEIGPGSLRTFDRIIMDGEVNGYSIVGNALIHKDSSTLAGTIIYCWGKIPDDPWINAIGDSSLDTHIGDYYKKSSNERWLFNVCVIIPDNIEIICDKAFKYPICGTISLPRSIKKIGKLAFNAGDLRIIKYNGTKAEWDMIQKDEHWIGGRAQKTLEKIICLDKEILAEEIFKKGNSN